jgi:hypothetical protein
VASTPARWASRSRGCGPTLLGEAGRERLVSRSGRRSPSRPASGRASAASRGAELGHQGSRAFSSPRPVRAAWGCASW